MRSFVYACLAAAVLAAPKEDLIAQLPDAEAFDTLTYSGYLPVTETKSLHYTFAESKGDPANDPVIIWFNGGPGCSSMLGFMQENGPRIVDDGETQIKNNPFPWNMEANVIWLESPAGVGFSLAGTAQDMETNDMIQSVDTLNAVKAWYAKFPEFKANKLFVSGESYAGIYVPYLAWQIYQNNLQAKFNPALENINLDGMMVGNGCTRWHQPKESLPYTLYNFNMIPKSLLDKFNDNKCTFSFQHVMHYDNPPACYVAYAQMQKMIQGTNIYDLYRKNYPLDSTQSNSGSRIGYAQVGDELKKYKRGYTASEYTPWLQPKEKSMLRENGEPAEEVILGAFVGDYLNRADVRKALNIPTSVPAYEECSSTVKYTLQKEGSYWIYPIIKDKVRILFYSGDTDGAVPTFESKQWIKDLNWSKKEAWRPWTTGGEVSGYVEKYEGLDFVTVKGVGHMAPQWKREAVTTMVNAWTRNKPF